MSDVKAIYSINAFPGNKSHGLAWPAMKRHLIDAARACFQNTQDNLGVLAYLVNSASYSEIYFMYHGRLHSESQDSVISPSLTSILPQFSGLNLSLSSSPSPSSSSSSTISVIIPRDKKYIFTSMPDQSKYNMQDSKSLAEYKFLLKAWQEESSAVETFRSKLIAALDEIALSALGDVNERMHMRLKEIFASLDRRFSSVSSTELKKELKRIREPLVSISSFDSVIQSHSDIHHLCEDQNMAISENQKIFDLQSSLENFGVFDLQYSLFDNAMDGLRDRKRTFKNFSGHCLKHWNNLENPLVAFL